MRASNFLAVGIFALLAGLTLLAGRQANRTPLSAAWVAAAPTAAATATPPAAETRQATPSATPTLTPSPTTTATRTPTAARPTVLPTATATYTPTATASATPATSQVLSATVNADVVNVRAGPGLVYAPVGETHAGDSLTVLARTDDVPPWYQVCCVKDKTNGWLRSDYLDVAGDANSIALATTIPAPPPGAPAANFLAPAPPPPAASAPAINPFTGLPGGNLGRRPVFVCLNNDPEARPQYGLAQADLVYEYFMEGRFITRYSALFYSQDAPRIGPIRSARLVNVQLTPLYQAALLCSGASSEVRWILKNQVHFPYLDVDLDDGSNTLYTYSIGSYYVTREQSDSARLDRFLSDWKVNRIPNTRGLRFGDYGGGTPASRVNLPYPPVARTAWTWNGSQWARLGSDGGAYLDGNTRRQITADNVVIQWAPHEDTNMIEDSLGSRGVRITLNGSGAVKILRDGKVIDGTWRNDDPNQPPEFFDGSGAPIALHTGHTWFEILEPGYEVTVLP